MKSEIRQAVSLQSELENYIFDLHSKSLAFLENNQFEEAEMTIKEAWTVLPEPKFNTSCTHIVLCSLIEILTINGNYIEAKTILANWINDIETCGYKINETTPFILSGENFLYLHEIEKAKEQFYKALTFGATKRDFENKPSLYIDIAHKKIIDDNDIVLRFTNEVLHKPVSHEVLQALTDKVYDQIDELSEKGNAYYDNENYAKAIKTWEQALALIPHPQNAYSESQWLETSIGDAYFLIEDYTNALKHLQCAKANIEESAYENPFIMLRMGQVLFEHKQIDEAKEYLLRAYMFEGEDIFEDEDEKYVAFLKQHVALK